MNLPGTDRADTTLTAGGSGVARLLPLCLLVLLAAAGPARALDPDRLLTQYGHTAWRTQDGYVYAPNNTTQTADGYIWIGTRHGLMRFDGVKFTPWEPPEGQSLPGGIIGALLGARDGSLWIGTTRGVARIKDGQYFNYGAQSGGAGISSIIEDEAGTIWFTRYRVGDGKGPLCQVTGEEFRCYGKEDGIPVDYGLGLKKDAAGNIWFGSSALVRWAPGSVSTYLEEELKQIESSVVDVAVGPSGEVWAGVDQAGAGRLLVELGYAQDLTVRVSDDGAGIDPSVAQNGKPGHFGLQGMRERAARIGGRLTVVSSAVTGTEVTVVVPGGVVYRGGGSAPSGWFRHILGR